MNQSLRCVVVFKLVLFHEKNKQKKSDCMRGAFFVAEKKKTHHRWTHHDTKTATTIPTSING